ncbi:mucin-4-like [Mya arenaria]|uniref:mucin-4-like n=1 Tax=Mya arenaria TaxID=6604 RepID=UPI0022E60537|nr:mucin-4-like [Mya arenaria]
MWSIWFIVAQAIPGIILGQVCPPELPVASMCVAGTVRGSSVALDISGAAGNGAETCTCAALATSSGVTVDIIAALKDVNCGTTLSILFKEKSIKTICGGSATHVSTGNSAFITYTRNLLIENPNSNYCITFASDRNDTTFTLTCTTPPTTTTKLPTQPQNTTISAQPETTISPGHQNITTTLGSLTTLSPPSTSVSMSSTFPGNLTTLPSSRLSTSVTSVSFVNTTAAPVATTSGTGNATTMKSNTTNKFSTTPGYNSTGDFNTTSTPFTKSSTGSNLNITSEPGNSTQTTEGQLSTIASTKIHNGNTTEQSTVANENVTSSFGNGTTTIPANVTDSDFNITTIKPENVTDIDFNSTTINPENVTDIDFNSTTVNPENVTDIYVNTTVTPENVTDIDVNATTSNDNSTEHIVDQTTQPSKDTTKTPGKGTTSSGFWEPPVQKYDPPKQSNLVVILVPLLAVVLIGFVAVATYIMCKRSRKHARQTMVPNEEKKSDQNGNVQNTGFAPSKENCDAKSGHLAGHFSAQSNGHSYADYDVERQDNVKAHYAKHTDDSLNERRNDSLLNTTQNGKPKAYEPNDRERDLMASLELSTINFESDPSDTNRYFKKEDPGDWYRVVMKGKKPKSSKSARKYKSNDKDHGKGKHRHRSRTKESSGHRSKRRSKSRSDSDGDYLASDSSNAKKSKSSTATSDSLKDSYSSKFGGTQSNEDRTESQAENRKDSKSMSSNPRLIQSQPVPVIHSKPVSEPKFVQSQSANKTRTLPQQRPTTLESKPKEPEPPKARVILSSSGPTNVPTAVPGGNSIREMTEDVNNIPTITATKQPRTDITSSVSSSSKPSPVPQRSNLFNNNGSSAPAISASRPDIVPPLNLTGTGDQLVIDDDGFEGFVLHN